MKVPLRAFVPALPQPPYPYLAALTPTPKVYPPDL